MQMKANPGLVAMMKNVNYEALQEAERNVLDEQVHLACARDDQLLTCT
jgi:hypothetical protein